MKRRLFCLALAVMVLAPRGAGAYSVLAHESNIDALWESQIRPLLLARYPRTSPDALLEARAYAYGGSTIQDLGYFPFGSKLFTNLLHYVKTGDFVQAMLHDSQDVNDLAFAIGALCHYASDSEGHAIAVNRSVPLMYPKLRAKYGSSVPYDEAPKEHILVEFAFDVLLVANGGYKLQAYHDFIGFKVAKPLLERAFRETYGLEMKDLFLSEDLAIGTYRHAVASTIPNVTKVAWEKKQDQIKQTMPGAVRDQFVLTLPRTDYEKKYGKDYQKPSVFARMIGALYSILPEDRAVPSAVVQGPAARSRTMVPREPGPHAGPLRRDADVITRRPAPVAERRSRYRASRARPASIRWPTRPCGSCRSAPDP